MVAALRALVAEIVGDNHLSETLEAIKMAAMESDWVIACLTKLPRILAVLFIAVGALQVLKVLLYIISVRQRAQGFEVSGFPRILIARPV